MFPTSHDVNIDTQLQRSPADRMGDDELAQIRAQRMAEMRAQGGGGGAEQQQKAEERAKQMTDMKNGILSQVLDQKVTTGVQCSVEY